MQIKHLQIVWGCQVRGCTRPPVVFCDHPVGNGKTCDMRLCGTHTWRPSALDAIDYCPEHRAMYEMYERKEAKNVAR